MKNSVKLLAITAIIAVIGFSMTGCEEPDNTSEPTSTADITYTATQTGGTDGTADSTGIVFTFSASVDSLDLTAADITVSGAAAKGASAALTGTGTSLTLAPITVNSAGLATVAIAKEGIEAVQKSVTIYKAGAYVPEYWSITWHLNGGAEGTGAYPTQIEKGTVLSRPSPDPTKAGSTFGGWYSDSGLAQQYTFVDPVTTNLNLYAKWVTDPTNTPNGDSMANAIPLTENQWADGSLPTSSDYQWFTFTATASTQYIHIGAGTLTNLYVSVYESDGTPVGGYGTYLSSNTYTSRTLTTGQTYYISVRPDGSISGTYRIGFNATTTPPPIQLPTNAITLTVNLWADGSIPTSDDEQWFTFTATASEQNIHINTGTLTTVYVQVYDSNGTEVGSGGYFNSSTNFSRSLTIGETYYIRVRPYSGGSGTYRIAFNTSYNAPFDQWPPDAAITLTENQWDNGSLPTTGDEQWFVFTATASTQWIHVDFVTMTQLYMHVYDSSGTEVGNQSYLYSSGTRASRSLTEGDTYYIRVRPYSSSYSGTYRIAFNTTTTAPFYQWPPDAAIPLTENQWTDGSLPTSSDVQWFTFAATASTQYIHIEFGTLTNMYAQVYDSSGAALGNDYSLYSSIVDKYISQTLVTGQTYYIRVRTYGSNSGAYRIGFGSIVPPGITPIPLTENQWTDGSLPTSSDVQWFTFAATASTQFIHMEPGTLTNFYVNVYNSSGATVGSETYLSGSTTNISRTLTEGQTYYIMVRRPSGVSGTGTYRIGFTTSIAPPPGAITLTENQFADGSIPTSNSQQWFVFTATASTQWIHVERGTLTNLYVQVYDSSGTAVGSEATMSSSTTSASRSLTEGDTYYIRVRPYSSSYSGTYRIVFNATPYPPGTSFIPLTVNKYTDGSLPTSSDRQWFTFTATASTQYIHIDFGTLTDLYAQVYDSNGATVGSETNLYQSTPGIRYTSQSLTVGQTYYIRVRPYSSSYSGTYKIGFTASTTRPTIFQLPSNPNTLTANQWGNGNIQTAGGEQWFTFTATANPQYIHFSGGTLSNSIGVYVQVCDSSGAAVGSGGNLSSSTSYASLSLTSGQTYYIMVRAGTTDGRGTYRIGFNTSSTAPTS